MVGCDKCDGTNNHYGHGAQKFLYNGMSSKEMRASNITEPACDPLPPARAASALEIGSFWGVRHSYCTILYWSGWYDSVQWHRVVHQVSSTSGAPRAHRHVAAAPRPPARQTLVTRMAARR